MSNYKNKRVLVTGGAGFIGSHIVEQLVKQDALVTIIDNFSTGSHENLKHLKNYLTIIDGDITNYRTLLPTTENHEIIFHCAALTSVPESFKYPEEYFQTNVVGTQNILEAAKFHEIERVIFSSSSAVYGPSEAACKETDPCDPQSPYGYSKLLGEQMCSQYSQNNNLITFALRYFNVYGSRQNPDGPYAGVQAKFNKLMNNNEPVTLFGSGSQTRDFISVKDVANVNLMCGLLPASIITQQNLNGTPLNVASGSSTSIKELFEQLKNNHPSYSHEPFYKPARPGDILHSAANCSRLHSIQKLFVVE